MVSDEGQMKAACQMLEAAETMRQMAGALDDSLQRHRLFLDEWLARFENALKDDLVKRTPTSEKS